jgi:Methyltransferase domain
MKAMQLASRGVNWLLKPLGVRIARKLPSIPYLPYPPLAAEHLIGAKLYATRNDLIADLPIAAGSAIAEIGVMRGDFSFCLMERLKPRKLVAFDLFDCHHTPQIYGVPSSEFFKGMTQLDYFRAQMEPFDDAVVIEQGLTKDTLPKYAGHALDMVYIDAGHTYEDVAFDARAASAMVNNAGILVFNDYIMFDHILHAPYGVVPVVNEMVVNQGWQVIGLALERQMFCDIAIRRNTVS